MSQPVQEAGWDAKEARGLGQRLGVHAVLAAALQVEKRCMAEVASAALSSRRDAVFATVLLCKHRLTYSTFDVVRGYWTSTAGQNLMPLLPNRQVLADAG